MNMVKCLIIVIVSSVMFIYGQEAWAGELGDRVYSPEGRAKLINHWAASGEICRALGHKWEITRVRELMIIGGPVEKRKCLICDKKEGKYVTTKEEWR